MFYVTHQLQINYKSSYCHHYYECYEDDDDDDDSDYYECYDLTTSAFEFANGF